MTTMGDRVKHLRKQRGLTQEELAIRLGYKSKSSVAHIELGRDIPRSQIVQLAAILDTTPQYLMGWDEKNAPDDVRSAIIEKVTNLSDSKAVRLLGYLEALEGESE